MYDAVLQIKARRYLVTKSFTSSIAKTLQQLSIRYKI